MRIIERQQRVHHRRGNYQRLGVRGERLEILRDLRVRPLVVIVRAAFPGVRGGGFRVAIFPVRPVAVIARHRDGSAGAEAEKTAADAEKLRAHDRQHAEGEQQLLEMCTNFHAPTKSTDRAVVQSLFARRSGIAASRAKAYLPIRFHRMAAVDHLTLLANYEPDAQWSMLNFDRFLAQELPAKGVRADVLRPPPRIGANAGKWIRYVDKYVFFQPALRRAARAASAPRRLLHICDHSNALYLHTARSPRNVVTCHDLIAVRIAKGEFPGIGTAWSGKILQRLILTGLAKSHFVVCDSHSTRRDLVRFLPHLETRSTVVHLSLDARWHPIAKEEARTLAAPFDDQRPIVFHLGANCWYKNWEGILRTFTRVIERARPDQPRPLLVLGSGTLSEENRAFIREHRLENDVVNPGRLTEEQILGLYNLASMFLFPSRIEGFGWPPLEAQACKCPVVCSKEASLAEVAEESALTAHPDDTAALATHIDALLHNPALRENIIERGLQNAARFTHTRTVEAYLAAYATALAIPIRVDDRF